MNFSDVIFIRELVRHAPIFSSYFGHSIVRGNSKFFYDHVFYILQISPVFIKTVPIEA